MNTERNAERKHNYFPHSAVVIKHTFGLGEYVVNVIVQVEFCSGCCSV